MNLITKLTEKLKVVGYKLSDVAQAMLNKIHTFGNSKVAKTLKTLTLCGVMAFSIATMSACNNTPTVDPGTSTVQPGGNENLKQYSQILQTVLTDSYYTKLVDNYKQTSVTYFSDPLFYAAPYSFLESQGHDVAAIKNGELECKTSIYTENDNKNNINISVKVENSHSKENYYTNYILSYTLSEKEYNDLYMLYNGNYAQIPLFIQELSKQKSAIVKSSVKVSKSSYNKLLTEINNYYTEPLNTNQAEIDLLDVCYDANDQSINIAVRSTPGYGNNVVTNAELRLLTLNFHPSSFNNLHSYLYITNMHIADNNYNEFASKRYSINYFNLADLTSTNYFEI